MAGTVCVSMVLKLFEDQKDSIKLTSLVANVIGFLAMLGVVAAWGLPMILMATTDAELATYEAALGTLARTDMIVPRSPA